MNIQIFKGRQGLQTLAPKWQELTADLASPRFFHLLDWHRCNLDFLEPDPESVLYCAFFDSAELCAILPVRQVKRTYKGLRLYVLELLQHDHMWLTDIVASASSLKKLSFRHLLDALQRYTGIRWDILIARHVLEDSALATIDAADKCRWRLRGVQTACSYVSVKPYEQEQTGLSKKTLANLRQASNRLSRMGKQSYVVISRASELAEAFNDFLRLEASGWKGVGGNGTAIKVDQRLVDFYRCLTERLGVAGNCEIHLLQLDGKSIAAMFVIVSSGTSYALKVGYDEAYERASPGHLLIENMIKHYKGEGGTHTLNFVTAMNWIRPWNPASLAVENRYYFNRTAVGLLGYGGLALRKGLERRDGTQK